MKIALISPRGDFWGNNRGFVEFRTSDRASFHFREYWSGISSGLLVIAGLTPPEHRIEFIDENKTPIDFERRYDLVAISAMTQQADNAYSISERFRSLGIPTVIGGIHATLLPEEARRHADSVVVGEGETSWPRLLADFAHGELNHVYETDTFADLAEYPSPRYELLKGSDYRVIWVQTTRGCPHHCSFCTASRIFGDRYRVKSTVQVAAEIDAVRSIAPAARLHFSDDNLFIVKKHYEPLLDLLAERNVNWVAQTDIRVGENESLLRRVRESGCQLFYIGIESVAEKSLRIVDPGGFKLKSLSHYSERIQAIQSAGIGVLGSFIVGFDSETTRIFDDLIEFIDANHLYGVQVFILTPFPGTSIRERLEREGRLLPTPWSNYTLFDVNFSPAHMSREDLERGFLKIYKAITSKEYMVSTMKYFKELLDRKRKRGEIS